MKRLGSRDNTRKPPHRWMPVWLLALCTLPVAVIAEAATAAAVAVNCASPPPSGTPRDGYTVIIASGPGSITSGTSGKDVIFGTSGNDRISGLGGDDIIYGLAGVDQLVGGDGDDTLCGGPDGDRLAGGAGNDILSGGDGDDDLVDGPGNDLLMGGGGTDRLAGVDGLDTCVAGGQLGDAIPSGCDVHEDTVLGEATAPLTRTVNPVGESSLGDIVADAQLWATSGPSWPVASGAPAVVSFVNPGALRAEIDAGPITFGEVFSVQPFAHPLVTMDMTGANIDAVLEQQFQGGIRTLQVPASLTYNRSNDMPIGNRVSNIRINGVPLEPAAIYRVTANNLLAEGADGFTVFRTGANRFVGEIDSAALARYIEFLRIVHPGPQNRIVLVV